MPAIFLVQNWLKQSILSLLLSITYSLLFQFDFLLFSTVKLIEFTYTLLIPPQKRRFVPIRENWLQFQDLFQR